MKTTRVRMMTVLKPAPGGEAARGAPTALWSTREPAARRSRGHKPAAASSGATAGGAPANGASACGTAQARAR
eukprot:scaffold2514_cov373-Prasinococcus_capsulatus_cf.AAC.5